MTTEDTVTAIVHAHTDVRHPARARVPLVDVRWIETTARDTDFLLGSLLPLLRGTVTRGHTTTSRERGSGSGIGGDGTTMSVENGLGHDGAVSDTLVTDVCVSVCAFVALSDCQFFLLPPHPWLFTSGVR